MPSDVTAQAANDVLDPTDSVEFRRTMAEFASGVTVVTALQADDASGLSEPVGFACQSFASVSLEPPLVLFCVDRHSRTWQGIRAAGRFCVNVLAEDQEELCRRFGSRLGPRFDGLEWTTSAWGTPALPGVLARVNADVRSVHPEGDHYVVIGHVVAVERPRAGRPMVFFRGRFGLDADERSAESAWAWLDGWI
ncbi:flavin reductase family protein [Streptomyces mirabilis]|uniref:flavin reductase family protein n=1 Tax=Streptomyces mirabilis TaxID=68239 RepID=UPI0033A22C64